VAVLAAAVLAVAVLVPPVALTASLMAPAGAVSRADRDAMASVERLTVPDVSFVVLSGARWGSDDVAEWFPALSARVSVVTGQGLEWTNRREAQSAAEQELRRCGRDDLGCVEAWVARYAPSSRVGLYVTGAGSSSGECCPAIADAVRRSARYLVLRDDAAALVAVPR
jgi:hypothetical protein